MAARIKRTQFLKRHRVAAGTITDRRRLDLGQRHVGDGACHRAVRRWVKIELNFFERHGGGGGKSVRRAVAEFQRTPAMGCNACHVKISWIT
ncbi:hypothetical protein D3C71_1655650 [compost metagenome]